MGTKTGISWTDATWNPIRGCSRVSEGCRHCYAERVAYRFSGPGRPYEGLVQIGANGERRPQWNGQVRFVEEHLLDPLRWKPVTVHAEFCAVAGKGIERGCTCWRERPRRIFVNSMSDLFHENVTDEVRDKIFATMALCPQHTFQVLTKRPERMLAYLTVTNRDEAIGYSAWRILEDRNNLSSEQSAIATELQHGSGHHIEGGCWPLPNVWLGVSVEDQKTADERIPLLLQTPAAVRFISGEPLLGAVDLSASLSNSLMKSKKGDWWAHHGAPRMLHWVIVGGESGPGARPMHPDWARSLRDQCKAAAVPFFFKQWGEWRPCGHQPNRTEWCDGLAIVNRWNGDIRGSESLSDETTEIMRRMSPKLSGHLLDGVEHHAFPETRYEP